MKIINITEKEKKEFNKIVTHPLQSFEWGKFREKTGLKVIRKGFYEKNKLKSGFQLTVHKTPKTNLTIGYFPKGELPDKEILDELKRIGKEENCIFIQLEPNVDNIKNCPLRPRSEASKLKIVNLGLRPSAHPLFTKYTFQLDLTKSEDELLKNMHPKTRYNIRVAQKHNVKIIEDNSEEAFKEYLRLTKVTTSRQKFFAHNENYHKLMWETLRQTQDKPSEDKLTARLFLAKYNSKILAAWIVFIFHDTLYYPYGASSSENREVMASNLMMWEVIKFGKKMGLKKFDMWGSLGPNPDANDPWFGFHRFKQGYGPRLVEFVGSYDLVIKPFTYQFYKIADKLRWLILKIKK
ncbi:MAG: peptidoglycan bridge formation glycyltransferase FemA/FemB family protein [Patescibacteria group bacterium]|nr:peptidoglycan bridge formation glycyltransferase FemA/FemB family protein [Patescibacteria group bacterium]